MDLDTRWVAHFEAAVAEISGGAVIDGELSSVEVIGVPKQAVSRVMLSLDGGRTLNEVAACLGMPASVVSAICGALSEASLIHKAEVGDRPVPHEEFAELSRRVFAAWKKRLFSHPLWQDLVAGTAPPGQFEEDWVHAQPRRRIAGRARDAATSPGISARNTTTANSSFKAFWRSASAGMPSTRRARSPARGASSITCGDVRGRTRCSTRRARASSSRRAAIARMPARSSTP